MNELCHSGIYLIKNKINGKVYVGQTINISKRWKSHLFPSTFEKNKKKPLYEAFEKYGIENFEFSVLEYCNKEFLNDREIYWIAEKKSLSPNGYNIQNGGQIEYSYTSTEEHRKKLSEAGKGRKPTEKTRKKLSEWQIGKIIPNEIREKISNTLNGHSRTKESRNKQSRSIKGDKNHFYGRTHSEETRKKISDFRKSHIGWKHSEETKEKMREAHKRKLSSPS
jgi:group I intron endonuclease